jgi:hypothetical protein
MPSPSRRGQILVALQKQLETITTANDYSISVYKVTTAVKSWQDTPVAETPVIYIIDESTRPVYHAGKLNEFEWQVGLFVVMKDRTQVEMEEHISDIMTCLFKNVTLYDADTQTRTISHLRILNIVTDNQLFSEIEGAQLFKITLEIRYTACVGDR